ncbi:organoarsenical effux MFS transporter ArsJ [Pseudaeromonas sp. ZJS20]|uniref:organoarsenical effux MFS transporter ArsJ n=1 Tax=Pseudaeromonas aegiceratis TaxID=3153928 RepID=UPI00390C4733
MSMLARLRAGWGGLSLGVRQYLLITANYWAFTLTDGALRMLVVLYFYQLGYSALAIASLFLFYELFGVVTNLFGGWLGARLGLNRTMQLGLGLQLLALGMLTLPDAWLTVPWVMAAQALSGIAKDLNKMSAKSAIKTLVPADAQGALYRWVALLTGSKNAMKGLGFFLGGALLALWGFQGAMWIMLAGLLAVGLISLLTLKQELGKAKTKPKFKDLLSKSPAINVLSAARLLLFGARDVWFVVALPLFLSGQLGWSVWQVGGVMALWVMGYGLVQALAPRVTGKRSGRLPDGAQALGWGLALTLVSLLIPLGLAAGLPAAAWVLLGLAAFGALFAVNSSLHSYLIVSYAKADGVSLDVGFYYMANALGRLLGTLLSGWLFGLGGLPLCLWVTTGLLLGASLFCLGLPRARTVVA